MDLSDGSVAMRASTVSNGSTSPAAMLVLGVVRSAPSKPAFSRLSAVRKAFDDELGRIRSCSFNSPSFTEGGTTGAASVGRGGATTGCAAVAVGGAGAVACAGVAGWAGLVLGGGPHASAVPRITKPSPLRALFIALLAPAVRLIVDTALNRPTRYHVRPRVPYRPPAAALDIAIPWVSVVIVRP